MKYYKVSLPGEESVFHESKVALSDQRVLRELVDMGELDPTQLDEAEVTPISEEEYEENCF